jgi:XTP/dITP diphosphohydrolase
MKKEIYYVTTNAHKFKIAENFFAVSGLSKKIKIKHKLLECPEIQEQSLDKIALFSARWAAKIIKKPVITSDCGFVIESLGGFPGPFVKYINNWLVPDDILKIMKNKNNRRAYFIDALAYAEPNGLEKVFSCKTYGRLASKPAIKAKSTVDSLFIPNNYNKPLEQLNEEEKINVWNTSRWRKFEKFIINRYD